MSLVLVGGVGVLGVALLRDGGPTASGTTPEATSTAEVLLEDERAPAGITGVSCQENTDDWAESGLSPYRCEAAAEGGAFLCDAGETLSEGFQLECDKASHYEAIRSDGVALAQRVLDALNQDDYWSTYVAALASHATDGRPLCSVHRALRDGVLEDEVAVNLYSPLTSTGAGLGTVLTVAPDGQVRDSPYQGSNLGDYGVRMDYRSSWGIGVCTHGDTGLTLDHVLIRPDTTASVELAHAPTGQADDQQVVAADGTPVPADALRAYEEGKAVGVEIREAIAAGLTGTYAEGENGAQRFFEDTRDQRNPYLGRSDDLQTVWYQRGSWEQSGLYDGPGQVVYEGGESKAAVAPSAGADDQLDCSGSGPTYKLPVDDPCYSNADNPAKGMMEQPADLGTDGGDRVGFVTPSGNVACTYRDDFELWCYVRSIRTLAIVNRSGAGRWAYVRRNVRQPSDIAVIRGPVLQHGDTWKNPGPFASIIRCVSRSTGLSCFNGDDTGFTASRKAVLVRTPKPRQQ